VLLFTYWLSAADVEDNMYERSEKADVPHMSVPLSAMTPATKKTHANAERFV